MFFQLSLLTDFKINCFYFISFYFKQTPFKRYNIGSLMKQHTTITMEMTHDLCPLTLTGHFRCKCTVVALSEETMMFIYLIHIENFILDSNNIYSSISSDEFQVTLLSCQIRQPRNVLYSLLQFLIQKHLGFQKYTLKTHVAKILLWCFLNIFFSSFHKTSYSKR